MTRENFVPSFLLVSALALPLAACGTTDGTPTPAPTEQATPTATPTATATFTATATPTAAALPQWQAFTSFAVAGEGSGSGGSYSVGDNGLYDAFDLIAESLIASVDATIDSLTDYPGQDDPCEGTDAGCPLTPGQATGAKAAAATAIEGAVSVDSINNALATAYSTGNSPQALFLNDDGSSLEYWSGEGTTAGWTPDSQIGDQTGTLASSGSEYAGTFTFGTTIGANPQSEGTEVSFDIYDALTTFDWDVSSIDGALTGGGIKIVALTNLVSGILDTLDDAGALPEDFDKDAAIAAVETVLVDNSDITCDGSNPCFSVTFSYDAEWAVVD